MRESPFLFGWRGGFSFRRFSFDVNAFVLCETGLVSLPSSSYLNSFRSRKKISFLFLFYERNGRDYVIALRRNVVSTCPLFVCLLLAFEKKTKGKARQPWGFATTTTPVMRVRFIFRLKTNRFAETCNKKEENSNISSATRCGARSLSLVTSKDPPPLLIKFKWMTCLLHVVVVH